MRGTVLFVAALACAFAAQAAFGAEDLSALKALVVVPPSDFRDEEFLGVKAALDAAKIGFAVASAEKGKVKGMLGLEEKKFKESSDAFRKLCAEYPRSDLFGMAQFNAAFIAHRHLKQPREAISEYGKLLTGDCNDWDNTGNLMTPYRNYRHLAIMAIGRIRMDLGEHAAALQAFLDAFHKDYYVSHCGTCLEGANRERAEWTSKAASALAGLPPDETQAEAMKKAAEAEAYLLELGLAYLKTGNKEAGRKAFAALKSAFPKSPRIAEIPEVKD